MVTGTIMTPLFRSNRHRLFGIGAAVFCVGVTDRASLPAGLLQTVACFLPGRALSGNVEQREVAFRQTNKADR